MRSRSLGGRQAQPGGEARPRRLVALVAAEDEHDRRQQLALLEEVDGLDPARRVEHAPAAAAGRSLVARGPAAPHRRGVEAHGVGVGPAADERLQQVQAVVGAVADEVAVVEAHRPAQLDDRRRRAADRLDPRRQLGRVADRRRQADQLDVGGQVDDDLLPHRPAVGVLQEVDLVEHDEAEVVERRRAGVDHVAQHLGRHHDDRGVAVDGVVAGQQADVAGAVALAEVAELLVRQRLQRRGVERPPPGRRVSPRCRTRRRRSCRCPSARRRRRGARRRGRRAPRAGSGRGGTGSRRRSRPRSASHGHAVSQSSRPRRRLRRWNSSPMPTATRYSTVIGTASAASEIGSPDGVITAATTTIPTIA